MSRPRPHTRVRIGRNVALTAVAIYCATRAVAYMPGIVGGTMENVIAMISLGGHLLWAWALAWALAAVLCVADMAAGHTRRGLPLAVGLGAAWGAAYLVAWAVSGLHGQWTTGWVTAINYLALSAAIGGLLFKVTALHDMAHPAGMEEADEEDAA
ncbi:hypothetical protein AB0K08_13495 [Citricoccus sp. NPDC055426]|uniref:hypothetical protein n=1 Tax=Citricoccus sp. NPDC055426 TaxID=3155536 RepID=UPI003439F1BD